MKNFIYTALAAVAVLFSSSCERNLTTYTYDKDCAGASFISDEIKYSMVKEDGNQIVVELQRGNTKGAISVSFEMEDGTDGVFVPEKKTFDFKDGENTASVAFKYPNIEDFLGEVYEFSLAIDPTQAAITGNDVVTIKAQRKLTENPLGMCILSSEWDGDEWPTEICNTVESPNYYILPDVYVKNKDLCFTMVGDEITIDDQDVDTYPGYGAIYLINATGTKEGNVITITGEFYLAAIDYSFGVCTEIITLP